MSNVEKYPKQVKKIVKKIKGGIVTLGIDAWMVLPNETEPPLEMHSGFSRFVFSILYKDDESGQVKTVTCNIPAEKLFYIEKITNALVEADIQRKLHPVVVTQITNNDDNKQLENEKTKLAKTLNLNYFNKTAVQLLSEDPNNKTKLLNQRKWLAERVAQYPNNQKQIDAIDGAIELMNSNQNLSATSTDTLPCVDIYKVDIRIPHAEKTDKNGNTFVYAVSVVCDLNKKNPIGVNITNCYAPPIFNQDKTVKADMSKAVNKRALSINLTMEEWVSVVSRLNNTLNNFETCNYNKQDAISKKYEYKHNS